MLQDIFNFNFLDKASAISVPDIIAALFVSFALGLFIYFVYVKTFKGVMHSTSFGISLIAMGLISSLIIFAVSTNLIAALGMVGALSIVRFRTVVKEPLDLVYLFWSITTGIVVGVGLIPLAIIGTLVIGAILYIFVSRKTHDTPYVVVVNCNGEKAEAQAIYLLNGQTKKCVIKAKSVSKEGVELTVEVRLKESSSQFINALLAIEGIRNATLVSYNGDYYM